MRKRVSIVDLLLDHWLKREEERRIERENELNGWEITYKIRDLKSHILWFDDKNKPLKTQFPFNQQQIQEKNIATQQPTTNIKYSTQQPTTNIHTKLFLVGFFLNV